MADLGRRDVVKMLMMLLPAAVIKCGRADVFDDEGVCVHVFSHRIDIPRPLIEIQGRAPARSSFRKLFGIGIPELLVCASSSSLTSAFRYFWPVSRDEFLQAQNRLSVNYRLSEFRKKEDLVELEKYIVDNTAHVRSQKGMGAILFVMNDYTRYFIADVIRIWQKSEIDEIVVFKDPTQPPYLCDYPGLQLRFKHPP